MKDVGDMPSQNVHSNKCSCFYNSCFSFPKYFNIHFSDALFLFFSSSVQVSDQHSPHPA